MPAAHERRRHYWIDPAFQGRYLARILLLELLVAGVTALLTLGLALALISPGFQVGMGWGAIFGAFIVLIVLVALGLVWLGIRISHKICGPVYRIRTDLAQIRKGQGQVRIHLRDGDELQNLASEINQTLDWIEQSGAHKPRQAE